ncbi:MAG: PAS domain S-box protein, partial [Methanoregula sp.]
MIENSTNVVYLIDREKRIQFINSPGARKIFNEPPDKIIGKRLNELFPQEKAGKFCKTIERIFDTGLPLTYEVRHKIPNRSPFFKTQLIPLKDEHQTLHLVLGITGEITREKHLELNLLESEEKYRTLVEQTPDIVFQINAAGKMTYVSPQVFDHLGYHPKELIGTNPLDYMPSEEREQCANLFRQAIEPRTVFSGFEAKFIDAAGRSRLFGLNGKPIFNTAGELTGFRGTARNIEFRKQLEIRILNEKKYLDTIINSVADPVYVMDSNHRYTLVNDAFCRFMGKPRNKIIGKTAYDLFSKKEADILWKADNDAFSPGSIIEFEQDITDHEGQQRIILGKKTPFQDVNGEKCLVVNFIDNTEKKHLEEQLLVSLHQKDLLLQEIHHRVKNNIQVILGLLMLQNKQITDPHIHELLLESENRVYSIALVHEKLYESASLSQIDYQQYLTTVGDYVFESWNVRPGAIQLFIHAEGIFLPIDKAIPVGLLTNELLTNSLKHAFPNNRSGVITIDIKKRADTIVYRFSDNGVGFPKDQDFTKTTSLGMRLVTSLVAQILGKITLTREKGTTFEIIFENTVKEKSYE